MTEITLGKVWAREVLDSRGFPTVEAELEAKLKDGRVHATRAIVPSGASTGEGEALELRDGDNARFLGKGVQKAVSHVRKEIAGALTGKAFRSHADLDGAMLKLDGTTEKSKLGANAILSVSMASARLMAENAGLPLYAWIKQEFTARAKSAELRLPVPLMNILNGGRHADNGLAIQEFMIVPTGFDTFSQALRAGCEVFHHLKKLLHAKGLSTGVGDEGGFAPHFDGVRKEEMALEFVMQAVEKAGYRPGEQISLALDVAASEFTDKSKTSGEVHYTFQGESVSSTQMVERYREWTTRFPILSIEDGLGEHDWKGWKALTDMLGKKCQLVGDDLFVTNPTFLKKGIEEKTANAILIKLNQIGTLSETLETMAMAKLAGYSAIASHRSGESEDHFIADLAVGTGCGQIKTGSASRSDRLAKYNQLLRIEEALGKNAIYAGKKAFQFV